MFPNQFEKAVCGFCTKTLFRSEQQAIRFGAYLGLGLIWTADTAILQSAILPDKLASTIPDDAVLSVSLLVSFFGVTGLLLAEGNAVLLEANWIFRATTETAQPSMPIVVEKLMLWAILPVSCAVAFASTYPKFGGNVTVLHLLYTVVFTWIMVTALVRGHDHIPFTWSVEPDTRQIVLRILGCLLGVVGVVPLMGVLEAWLLRRPALMLSTLLIGVAGLWINRRQRNRDTPGVLTFSESNRPFALLKLS